jgi:hypothetical protein
MGQKLLSLHQYQNLGLAMFKKVLGDLDVAIPSLRPFVSQPSSKMTPSKPHAKGVHQAKATARLMGFLEELVRVPHLYGCQSNEQLKFCKESPRRCISKAASSSFVSVSMMI